MIENRFRNSVENRSISVLTWIVPSILQCSMPGLTYVVFPLFFIGTLSSLVHLYNIRDRYTLRWVYGNVGVPYVNGCRVRFERHWSTSTKNFLFYSSRACRRTMIAIIVQVCEFSGAKRNSHHIRRKRSKTDLLPITVRRSA